ncbi:MAG: hypothetical protein MK212_21455 [Saprospiraceae bacterium]|nr:hypothetical protein [Saprospiraceae bacterium]
MNSVNDPIKVELLVNTETDLTVDVQIKNTLDSNIIVNRFVWSTVSLILEIKDMDGNKLPIPTTPPMPLENLAAYDVIIKSNGLVKFNIQSMHLLEKYLNEKAIQIRCKGSYKKVGGTTALPISSDWVTLDKQ